jgi:hypothetical protein
MISVSVETDIRKAMEFLNLLPKEANRAAYRAINKIADEIKKDSAQQIAQATGMTKDKVFERMYVKGASAQRLLAVVGAMPSAKNVGYYDGANPRPKPATSSQHGGGVSLRAWGKPNFYDRTFVMGAQKDIGGVPRKVWRRTGPGEGQITDKVYGPSIRKTFTWAPIRKRQAEIIQKRWPYHFERYLRGELVKLRGADALRGIKNVAPFLSGATSD